MTDYAPFFSLVPKVLRQKPKEEVDLPKEAVAEATDWLTFSQHPGYAKLLEWLEREADRPVTPRSEVIEMVNGIARQNTLKEVRDHLRKTVAESQATLNRYREDSHA